MSTNCKIEKSSESEAPTLKNWQAPKVYSGSSWVPISEAIDTTGGDITSGWEVPDGTLQANFGSNVSESSGIFTFSKTGFYKISFFATIHNSNEIEADIRIQATTDAFSSVDEIVVVVPETVKFPESTVCAAFIAR